MSRSIITVLAIATTSLVVELGTGCAAPAPPVDDGTEDAVVASNPLVTFVGSVSSAPRCTPGEPRDCKIYWTDSYKIHHCTASVQVCNASYRWTECGDLDAGVLPDAAPDAEASADLVTEN